MTRSRKRTTARRTRAAASGEDDNIGALTPANHGNGDVILANPIRGSRFPPPIDAEAIASGD